MGEEKVDAYAEGFKDGWDKCRDFICKDFKLNKKVVLAWENSDASLEKGGKKNV